MDTMHFFYVSFLILIKDFSTSQQRAFVAHRHVPLISFSFRVTPLLNNFPPTLTAKFALELSCPLLSRSLLALSTPIYQFLAPPQLWTEQTFLCFSNLGPKIRMMSSLGVPRRACSNNKPICTHSNPQLMDWLLEVILCITAIWEAIESGDVFLCCHSWKKG